MSVNWKSIKASFSEVKTLKSFLIGVGVFCFLFALATLQIRCKVAKERKLQAAIQEEEAVIAVREKALEGYLDFREDSSEVMLGVEGGDSDSINNNTVVYLSMRDEGIKLPVGLETLRAITKQKQRVILKGTIAERKSSFSVWQYVVVRLQSENELSPGEQEEEAKKNREAWEKFLEREKELELLPPDWYSYNSTQFRTSLLLSGRGKLAIAGKWKYFPRSSDHKEAFFRIEVASISNFYQAVEAWFAAKAQITDGGKPLTQNFLCAINGEKVAALGEFKQVGEGEGQRLICTNLKIRLGLPR